MYLCGIQYQLLVLFLLGFFLLKMSMVDEWVMYTNINPLKTSPEYTWAGVYGKCVL